MDELEMKKRLEEKRKEIHSFDDLVQFLKEVKENCNIGYGNAPRAIAQAALAVAWRLADEFGITGFQAGFVMWDFVRGWTYTANKCGLKILDYDKLLYPQYKDSFKNTISSKTFASLQEEAKRMLAQDSMHPEVRAHLESIVNGEAPHGFTIKD